MLRISLYVCANYPVILNNFTTVIFHFFINFELIFSHYVLEHFVRGTHVLIPFKQLTHSLRKKLRFSL